MKRWNIINILLQIFFHMKDMIFFGVFGRKTGRAGPIILKLSTKRNQVFLKKKLENKNFMAAALHAQIWFLEIQPIIEQHLGSANQWQPGSQIFLIWNNSQWEQRYSFCQILNFQSPEGPNLWCSDFVLKQKEKRKNKWPLDSTGKDSNKTCKILSKRSIDFELRSILVLKSKNGSILAQIWLLGPPNCHDRLVWTELSGQSLL